MTRSYVNKIYIFIFALPIVYSSIRLFALFMMVSLVVLAYFCLLDTFIMADIFYAENGKAEDIFVSRCVHILSRTLYYPISIIFSVNSFSKPYYVNTIVSKCAQFLYGWCN